MNAAYYAELSTILKQRFDELKPVLGDKRAPAIELIRYHLLSGSSRAKDLAESLAEEERAAKVEVTEP